MTLINQLKAEIEKAAESKRNKEYPPQYVNGADINTSLRWGYRTGFENGAEFLLPLIDVLVRQRNYFMDGLFKDVDTEIARRERLNQELINTLREK